jgi:Flp pilus assembly pilin Flp
MMPPLRRLIEDESGQDFVEYTLILAFVVVCVAALLLLNGDSVAFIWRTTDNNLSAARQAVS